MKNLLLVSILLLPLLGIAQDQMYSHLEKHTVPSDGYYRPSVSNKSYDSFTPGMELQKAARRQITGIVIAGVGTVLGTVIAGNGSPGNLTAGSIMIAGSSITGLILNISAWSHIKNAGQLMDSQRVSLSDRGLVIGLN